MCGRVANRIFSFIALAMAIAIFAVACGGGNESDPLKLVPAGSNLVAQVDLKDLLASDALAALFDAVPKDADDPQTLDQLLNEAVAEIGVDFRQFSQLVVFGDISRDDDFFGFIAQGTFNEAAIVSAIEKLEGSPMGTSDYKGRRVYSFGGESDDPTLAVLYENTLVLGTEEALQAVIDVQRGDRGRMSGPVPDAFEDLGDGLFRLALKVPPDALQDQDLDFAAAQIPFLSGGEGLPLALDALRELDVFALVVDQDGQSLDLRINLDFATEESASTVGDLLDGLLKVAGGLLPDEQVAGFLDRIQVDREGSKLTMSLDLQLSELKDLVEGVFGIAQEESFRQEFSPAQAAERETLQTAINALMVDNSLVQVTTLATAVNDFSGLDLDPSDGEAFLTSYLRETTTTYYYCWDDQGKVFFGHELLSSCPQRVSPATRLLMPDEVALMPTRNHVEVGESVFYITMPPTSGDHWGRWADCGFYEDGLPDELITHNLEHGNIVVSYNLANQQDVDRLRVAMNSIELASEWGVTRFYDKIPEGMVAVVAWGRRARMPGFDLDGLAGFFAAYAGAMGPERIAC